MAKNPTAISDNIEDLLAPLKDEARNGSKFVYGIAALPDGRLISCSPRTAARWGLKIVQQGDNDSLYS